VRTEIVARIVCGLAGACLLGVCFLLSEEEENNLQSMILAASSAVGTTGSRVIAIAKVAMQATLETTVKWLDQIYGARIFSVKAAQATATIGFIPVVMIGFVVLSAADAGNIFTTPTTFKTTFGELEFLFCVLPALGVAYVCARITGRKKNVLLALGTIAYLAVSVVGILVTLGLLTFLQCCAFLFDIAAIAILRWMLRWSLRLAGPWQFFVVVTATFASIACSLALALDFISGATDPFSPLVGFALLGLGIPSSIPAFVLAITASITALQALFWPFLRRSIASVHRHRVIFEHRTAAIGIGIYLLLFAFVPKTVDLFTIIHAIGKLFGVDLPAN
jgi:hypothetical protein